MKFSLRSPLNIFGNSIFVKSLVLFDLGDRRKLILTTLTTIFLAGLDLVGVLLIGVVTSVAFNGFTTSPIGDSTKSVTEFLKISGKDLEFQITFLATSAVVLFIMKSLTSMYLNRRLYFFLSNRSARLSEQLIMNYFDLPIEKVEKKSIQSSIYTLITVPGLINSGIVGGYIQIMSDLALLLTMLVGLVFVDPITTAGLIIMYSILILVIIKLTHSRVAAIGKEIASLTIESGEKVNELSSTFRELSVKGAKGVYAGHIAKVQYKFAHKSAELSFLSNVSKYIFEIVMVVSISLMILYQLQTQSVSRTVAVSAVFVAASVRIMPAMMRLQQNIISARRSFNMSTGAFDLIDEIRKSKSNSVSVLNSVTSNFVPRVKLVNVSFGYEDSNKRIFENLDLQIESGEVVGIMGRSGIGKSTLVDLILGFLKPNQGRVEISNVDPSLAISVWPGQISYLPQKTFVISGSVKSNLALGLEEDKFTEADYVKALEAVSLDNLAESYEETLSFSLNEDAKNISGGQRQRIGIARAILSQPKLLILDEATSSLDVETENQVMKSLKSFLPHSTIIFISHRKSALDLCDRLFELSTRGIIEKQVN